MDSLTPVSNGGIDISRQFRLKNDLTKSSNLDTKIRLIIGLRLKELEAVLYLRKNAKQ